MIQNYDKKFALFSFNDVNSQDLGLENVNYEVSGAILEEPFLISTREPRLIESRFRNPMFQDIIEYPLIIKLEFAFVDGFTEAKLREVKRLFSQSYYKKMIFSDHPERHYYVLLVDDSFLSQYT